MKKRIFALAVAVMMLASFATTASAAETQNPYELPYDVDSGEMFECSESLAVGDIRTRAILGTGTLYHSDPLIGYPKAFASAIQSNRRVIFFLMSRITALVALIQRLNSPFSVRIPFFSIARTVAPSWTVGRSSTP